MFRYLKMDNGHDLGVLKPTLKHATMKNLVVVYGMEPCAWYNIVTQTKKRKEVSEQAVTKYTHRTVPTI
ncbi:hypothetical protein DOY81_006309 [Sarcophaga bullata]|nr:hypothetical protein DOY81_006309 [Sarcophaga bullata]